MAWEHQRCVPSHRSKTGSIPPLLSASNRTAFRPSKTLYADRVCPSEAFSAHLAPSVSGTGRPSALRAGIFASHDTSCAHFAPSALRAGTKNTHQCTHEKHTSRRESRPLPGTCCSFSTSFARDPVVWASRFWARTPAYVTAGDSSPAVTYAFVRAD